MHYVPNVGVGACMLLYFRFPEDGAWEPKHVGIILCGV
jgi:hypothetical protein